MLYGHMEGAIYISAHETVEQITDSAHFRTKPYSPIPAVYWALNLL